MIPKKHFTIENKLTKAIKDGSVGALKGLLNNHYNLIDEGINIESNHDEYRITPLALAI